MLEAIRNIGANGKGGKGGSGGGEDSDGGSNTLAFIGGQVFKRILTTVISAVVRHPVIAGAIAIGGGLAAAKVIADSGPRKPGTSSSVTGRDAENDQAGAARRAKDDLATRRTIPRPADYVPPEIDVAGAKMRENRPLVLAAGKAEAEKKQKAWDAQNASTHDPVTGMPKNTMIMRPPATGTVTSKFGVRKDPISGQDTQHDGVDIEVPMGTSVFPVAKGEVIAQTTSPTAGTYVSIKHDDGKVSEYMHLSRASVKVGDLVDGSKEIGKSGGAKGDPGAGKSTGPHLHLQIRDSAGKFIDPVSLNSIGLFTGDVYLEKASGLALTSWYSGLGISIDTNVLVLKNKTNASYSDTTIDSSFVGSYYDDINRLVSHNKAGKRDQKLYTFKRSEIQEVTLSYSSAFGSSLYPTTVKLSNSAGFGTFCLYFNPASTNINTSERSWIDVSTRTTFAASAGNTGNIPDFNDISYIPVIGPMSAPSGTAKTASIDGYSIQSGNIILIKSQADSTKNGIYRTVVNNTYTLARASDLNATNELYALGRVSYSNRTYDLNLPEDSSAYNLGASALNTPLFWKSIGSEYTINVAGVAHTNFSDLTRLPDNINGIATTQGDKILFISQSTSSQNIVARINKFTEPNLIRVGNGSSTINYYCSADWAPAFYAGGTTSFGLSGQTGTGKFTRIGNVVKIEKIILK